MSRSKLQTYATYANKFRAPTFKSPKKKYRHTDFIIHNKPLQQINVVLFGCGMVGTRVIENILENRELHTKLFNISFNVKAIFDSSGFVYSGSRTGDYNSVINDATLINVLEWKAKNPLNVFRDIGFYYNDFERMRANLIGGNNDIIIDCSNCSEESAHSLDNIFLHHSKRGGGIVLANKKQLSSVQSVFDQLTSPERLPRIGYNACVGSSLPVMDTMRNLTISGDNIYKMEGLLSGSIGFILGKWQLYRNGNLCYDKEKGVLYDIVIDAISKGYTEPDLREDLLGIDSARKAVILARTLGLNCDFDDVLKETVSLIPMDREKVMNLSGNEFVNLLKELNENDLEEYLIETCKQSGWYCDENMNENRLNLKYVTVIDAENETVKVELRNVTHSNNNNNNASNAFENINGSHSNYNILQFTTNNFPSNNPLTIQGLSSGADNAASAVIADLYKVAVAINYQY